MKSGLQVLIFFFCSLSAFAQGLPPIGQWRDHLPMRSVLSLEGDGSALLAATPYGYFTYAPATKEIATKTKTNGLSQVEMRLLSKDPNSKKLLAVYQNANLDLLEGDKIRNIPDLFKSNIQVDKTINHVQWLGEDAFLSTNFGIVVVNTNKFEIKETYRPGNNGAPIQINQTAFFKGALYAASQDGLLKASYPSAALADFRNWQVEDVAGRLPVQRILVWKDQLVLQRNDSLFLKKDTGWNLLYNSNKFITCLVVANDKLYVGLSELTKGSFVIIDPITLAVQTLTSSYLTYPTDCIVFENELWAADLRNGIIQLSNNASAPVFPETPAGIALGEGFYADGILFAASGELQNQVTANVSLDGVYKYDGNSWRSYTAATLAAIDSTKDIRSLVYLASSGSVFAGSHGGGLLEITKENKAIVYKQGSFLSPVFNANSTYRVGGLAVDRDQQIWMTNSGAPQGVIVRKADGTTRKFTIPFSYTAFGLSKIIVDQDNRKWIIAPNGDGVFCFDHGNDVDQTGDDQWRQFKQGLGRGNLPSNNVKSLVSDKNGFVWIGTDKGLAVIQCTAELFTAVSCEAVLPVVQQDNFAGRLLAEEIINDIQVDGADRKWVATSNGVWLLSADGQKIINRFTEKNSLLLSDDVRSIVVQQQTGEVFFFTKSGICSFRGTANAPETSKKKPFVFPNPVPPGYSGTIAIRDLPENAWVRITEMDGRLVYQTRSLGGQAVWNGRNYKGERASSGTYLIFVSDEYNTQQVAGKIFFIK